MERRDFDYLCDKAKEGREDIFVEHPSSGEGGVILSCGLDQFVVKTSEGEEKSWQFSECEETLSRREIFPYR